MTEELKQKAKGFINRINKESDGGMWLNNYYLSDLLVMFTTEMTKELQEENKKIYQRMTGLDEVLDHKNEQIEKMKSDVRELITDRMNDDLDQNIIERLFEKWELAE